MAEPSGSNMPTSYDDETTLLGELFDQRNFTLVSNISAAATDIEITENVSDMTVPFYVIFTTGTNAGEILYVEGITDGGTHFNPVVRNARGSGAATHDAGDQMAMILSGMQMMQFRDAIIAGQEFQGLVGTDASKSGSPALNEVYYANDTNKVYVCLVAGTWTWVGNRDEHADLLDLDHTDAHTIYHNDSRALSWHNGLSGDHVTGGDTHDHGQAATEGAGRVQSGLASAKPGTSVYLIEIYYATDTDELWISKGTASPSDWVKITGAPAGTIVAFFEADITTLYSGACPPGWTRYTALDGRFPKGAPTGVTSPLNSGGSQTHTHTYTEIPQHLHTVLAQGPTATNNPGTHSHGIKKQGSSGGACLGMATLQAVGTGGTQEAGDHKHTLDIPAHMTNLTKRTIDDAGGGSSGTTESVNNEPPYQEMIFCEKS